MKLAISTLFLVSWAFLLGSAVYAADPSESITVASDGTESSSDARETLQLKRRVRDLLDKTPTMLAGGATMPPSTESLEVAYASSNTDDMVVYFIAFYMDMKLDCDMDESGGDMCFPTIHPCTDPDDEVTKERVPPLYQMALNMMEGREPALKLRIWKLVVDKLAKRVGLENNAFRDWCKKSLGVPTDGN